jgi:DNA topoisomerase-1
VRGLIIADRCSTKVQCAMPKIRHRRPAAIKRLLELTDPVESAKASGLSYVTDTTPGITRKSSGKKFRYFDPRGKPVRNPDVLSRIKSLAVPPAWTNVWICPSANGHLQATGRDAKGRKQHRYHARWRQVRDQTKYDRMIAFGHVLPKIRARVEQDLALPGLPRAKVIATVVKLLETTLIRVGNEEYARENKSFGLTTMREQHVEVSGAKIRFAFRGKSGVKFDLDVKDRRLAKIVQRCQDLPGQELFRYIDDDACERLPRKILPRKTFVRGRVPSLLPERSARSSISIHRPKRSATWSAPSRASPKSWGTPGRSAASAISTLRS